MKRIILKINGMKCGMCESHINNLIRKNLKIKKVKSSFKKATTLIILKEDIDVEILKKLINETGYVVENIFIEN